MSKEDKYRCLVANLESKSSSKVNNALLYIRSKVIKEKGGVDLLCRFGLASSLLSLLGLDEYDNNTAMLRLMDDNNIKKECGTDNRRKQADIILSILSNMCMEKSARTAVASNPNSIPNLVTLLQESESESIKNRATRTLANLALDSGICNSIVKANSVEAVVDFMSETQDKECKKTCCRAIRLFGYSDKNRVKVVSQGGVFPVALLLKEEDKDLVEYALRALSELSKKCSLECATQIQSASVIEKIVDLAEAEGNWNGNSHATKIFINLMDQPNARASIGTSGGIDFLLKLLNKEETTLSRVPLLNALCLFCRESVNRIRIREKGILDLFVKALQDKTLQVLYARIISAIVCFLYDEQGLNHLLSLGAISILLDHFQTFAEFSSNVNQDLKACTETEDALNMSVPKENPTSVKYEHDDNLKECADQAFNASVRRNLSSENHGNSKEYTETKEFVKRSSVKRSCNEGIENGAPLKKKRILDMDNLVGPSESYSRTLSPESTPRNPDNVLRKAIQDMKDVQLQHSQDGRLSNALNNEGDLHCAVDSPDLQIQTKSSVEGTQSESQMKSEVRKQNEKKTTRNVYSLDSPTYEAQYNEWSLDDFRSSVKCKQSFSPDSLSQRSGSPSKLSSSSYPEALSPFSTTSQYSPDYSPQYNYLRSPYLSPVSSPASTSLYFTSPQRSISPFSEINSDSLVGDSVEAWQYSSDDDNSGSEDGPRGSKDGQEELVCNKEEAKDTEISAPTVDSSCEPDCLVTNSCDGVQNSTTVAFDVSLLGTDMDLEKDEIIPKSEASCSALKSAKSEPKTAEKEVKNSQYSLDKKELVQRATVNNILIMFSRISQMPDPCRLISEKFSCCLLDYITLVDSPSPRACRVLQRLIRNPLCLESLLDVMMPVYLVNKVYGGKIPPVQARGSDTKKPFVRFVSSSDVDDLDESRDSSKCDVENTQDLLLQDLSFVVESSYGRGTVAHILKRKPHAQRIRCLLCLPYLCRNPPSQKKTMFEDEGLFQLLNLKNLQSTKVLEVVIQGLEFISHFAKVKLQLIGENLVFPRQTTGMELSSKLLNSAKPLLDSGCVYRKTQCMHDLDFLVGSGVKLTASKTVLVSVSQVFTAMLEGDYTESRQTQITIPHTSPEAFQFLLHYLHGCGVDCSTIHTVINGNFSLQGFFDILTLADRYLFIDLKNYLAWVAARIYLNFSNLSQIYCFANLHHETLAADCLRYLLTQVSSGNEKIRVYQEVLSDSHCPQILNHIHDVLKCHIYNNI